MPDNSSDGVEEAELYIEEARERMQKSLEAFVRDIDTIRGSRATSAMVDNISVDYYGAPTPLNQAATVSVPEARVLMITPFESKMAGEIEKAILKSDLNITPQNDGSVIRIILPELSMERRKELVKQLKNRAEEGRISIRNIRRDSNDHIKKLSSGQLSEDDIKSYQKDVQNLTDNFIRKVEEAAEKKEKDILTV